METAQTDPYSEEIKEFHFHVYYFQTNPASRASALAIRDEVTKLTKEGFFHAVPLHTFNDVPRGPHTIGRVYSWFVLHRGEHSILIHPLTKKQGLDHSDRAAWIGKPVPLDLTKFDWELDKLPIQYPELGLGYSKKS